MRCIAQLVQMIVRVTKARVLVTHPSSIHEIEVSATQDKVSVTQPISNCDTGLEYL